MVDIKYCPSTLAEGYNTYSPQAVKRLFDGKKVSPFLDFNINDLKQSDIIVRAMQRISVSGVQEKFSGLIDHNNIRIAESSERSTYIIKPAPWDETIATRKQIPANEHVTMQIARQVYGILTAENGLCFTKDGQTMYITKRFDVRTDGRKVEMEDFATLVGRNEQTDGTYFKYSGCYEDIAKCIRKTIPAWMVDMERFFELVVFNYIYANGDNHLKNFSVIRQGGDYRLAPAYDLLNTSLHVTGDDFGLDGGLSPNIEKSDVMVRTGHPCRLDFERFGAQIGLTNARIKRVLDKYMIIPELTTRLIESCFLNDKMKRKYLRIVDERVKRFVRQSE
jgi:serine/threonine-protein kinase HipA